MADVVLQEKLLAGLAGWEVVKQARTIVAENRVLSSSWEPPLLRGVVQSGTTTYRAGLAIRRENDAENLCTCRQSREWGTLCPHSVAVGLHFLKPPAPPTAAATPASLNPGTPPPKAGLPPARPRDTRHIRRAHGDESGEPLQIHVILPPNLPDAIRRGRPTIFLEGRWSRGLAALASLPLDVPFTLDEPDTRLLDVAERLALGDTPAMLQLAPPEFGELLDALANHPRVTFGKKEPATISREPGRIALRAHLEATGEILLSARPASTGQTVIPGRTPWLLQGTTFRPLALPTPCLPVLEKPLRIPRIQVPLFVSEIWPRLADAAVVEADFAPTNFKLAASAPVFHLHLSGGLAGLVATLQCQYGARVLTVGQATPGEAPWHPDPSDPRAYTTRDPAAEQEALQRLVRAGFRPAEGGRWRLDGQNPVLTFFARTYPALQRAWKTTLEERLERSTREKLEPVEPRFSITPSGEQWFDLQVSYASSGGERIPNAEVLRLLRGGQSFTRLKSGRFALIDTGAVEELEEILVDCAPEQHAGGYRLRQAQAGFLNSTLQQFGWAPAAPATWTQRAREQSGEVTLTCPPLGHLDAVLRPYQKHGVAWLHFLRRNGFGGILADDMGLGKTLQALAFLQSLATAGSSQASRRPSLVVCPTSVVPNWLAEAARFTPGLRVVDVHGPDRHEAFQRIPGADLVVTSYALVRRDLARYQGIEFDTVILDEAQHIKNRQTQNAQAVKAIRSAHRLVLTGTPLENSVLDLWSIFDFLMPGYLGAAQDFRERYEAPIVRERDAAVQARLARRIRPFLLRRLKREVAPELPARIDQVVWCELSEGQAALYQQLLEATRREVTDAVGRQGLGKSRLLVLTALLRLRQVCCDLRLLDARPDTAANEDAASKPAGEPPPGDAPSGKTAAFAELLEEVIDGGHRALVFSQFTSMLGLLREELKAREIPVCYLDGATRDRGAEVARFQGSKDIPVFLISLKAGGVGLNLTAADTVIHFDPWWNPAVEDQATDRAHRIGQTQVVTSYKLITRGTVEEKILALQNRKREVLKGLLAGEEQLAESVTWEEIQELLA